MNKPIAPQATGYGLTRSEQPGAIAAAIREFLAIGSVGDRMLILLDIEKLMSSAEMGLVAQTLQ